MNTTNYTYGQITIHLFVLLQQFAVETMRLYPNCTTIFNKNIFLDTYHFVNNVNKLMLILKNNWSIHNNYLDQTNLKFDLLYNFTLVTTD